MKKKYKILFITVISIIIVLFIISFAGVVTVSKAMGAANDPGVKPGQTFFFSKYLQPDRFDFICFTRTDTASGVKVMTQFRLCGLPGDELKMEKGKLFVNGKDTKDDFEVKHSYLIEKKAFLPIKEKLELTEKEFSVQGTDSIKVSLTYAEAEQFGKMADLINTTNRKIPDGLFKENTGGHWTVDDFGPLTVPPEFYFVLGDNRHLAVDSRYLGFVDKAQLAGTVFWKN